MKQSSTSDPRVPSSAPPNHAPVKVTVIALLCLVSTLIFSIIARAQVNAPTNASADPATPAVATKTAGEELPLSAPEVIYEDGQLSINATNSTLGDILAAVRKVMGADIDIPPKASRERMAAKLGPGPAREVISSLLSWTDYNYLIQASDSDPDGVQSILLTARTKSPNANPIRAARVQASGTWAPQAAARANARTKEEAGNDSSEDDQAAVSPGPQNATDAEQVAQGSSQPAANASVASASASAPAATADSTQEAPAEIAQSSKSDSGDNQAPKSSERMMQLQSLYEQRKQMIQDSRKSSSQD